MLVSELKSKINLLWNKFWSGGISNPLQAIEQMSYLLFMKKLEDEDVNRRQNSKLVGEKFKSIFKGNENCKWSTWTEMPAEQMIVHVRDIVFPFLRKLNAGEKSIYRQYMKDSSFIIPTPALLTEAVKIINDLHIKDQNRDTQGDIYEYLLGQLRIAGKNGQFRTPPHIRRMMTKLANPKFGDKIGDVCCGTAGFLISAFRHILRNNTSKDLLNAGNIVGDKLNEFQWEFLREESLYGFDFDPTMVRISLMNLIMHGISNPNVTQVNTLSKRFAQSSYYNVILGNPPFKGSIDESDIGENFRTKTKKTELLFLELIYNILKEGGRAAVIVPEGVLFGPSKGHLDIRKLLLDRCRLDGVISMPTGVFKPYAGVSTAVLLFTKGEPTKEVWFYDMENDGFSLDDKRVKIDEDDIPDIIERFDNRHKEKNTDRRKKHFFVPVEEIKERNYDLSISKYTVIETREKKYEKPEVYLKKIVNTENKIIEIAKYIEKSLSK